MGGLGTQAWRMGGLRDGVGMGGCREDLVSFIMYELRSK